MIQAYTLNTTVAAGSSVPFNNVTLKKGCTAVLNGTSTIELNNCGVYMVSFDCSSAASVTMQAYVDGVPLSQAQAVGNSPSFTTLIPVTESNNTCCSVPTTVQIKNAGTANAVLTDANIVVTKVC